ncbi:MAG: hypothetical protein IIY82_08115 [Firmicutes bacterium]|nr:hypothetical protein [Bacillota bacterium]
MFTLPKYREPDFSDPLFTNAPDAVLLPSPRDKAAPDHFHATSIFPEYFKIDGEWLLAEDTRMDCVAVYDGGRILVKEFRNLHRGELVVVGRTENCEEGIYVHANCFERPDAVDKGSFFFRQSRTRETAFSYDYKQLIELLQYEKEHQGYVTWVLGPAVSFDAEAREDFAKLIRAGYVQAVLAGNALATHDLEGAYLGTALGQDIYTQEPHFNGHYNHIDTINKINRHGSIPAFIEKEGITNGIIYTCVKERIPFVLNGSIRDDGPLPEVYEHTYEGQDTIRSHVRRSTTVIGMATVLHTIATGNMTPIFRVLADGTIRPLYFYMIDTSDWAASKLGDRGSLSARGIVTNVQDFLKNITAGLAL